MKPMNMSESRRRKLQQLRRQIAAGDFAAAASLLAATGPRAQPADLSPAPLTLVQACPGRELTLDTAAGPVPYWHIRRRLKRVAPADAAIAREYASVLRGARQRFDELELSEALAHVSLAGPGDLLFMDIETCGLAGCAIFLIGVMAYERGDLVFEQLLARDYGEEPAICQAFTERLAAAGVLVTFNGKSFDMTMIRERAAFHGVGWPDREPPHLDLLHEVRRRWRAELPNCRLQTLEQHFCGRHRVGDIPGSGIPAAYHRFVDTADARPMADILHHNLLDMLTMAQLVVALLTGRGPGR